MKKKIFLYMALPILAAYGCFFLIYFILQAISPMRWWVGPFAFVVLTIFVTYNSIKSWKKIKELL